MLEWDERMHGWAAVDERGWTLRVQGHGRRGVLSIGQGLVEVEVWDRLWIRGIETGGLIKPELGLGWGAGGTQERRPAGKIEVGQDRADGKGIGSEGDDGSSERPRSTDAATSCLFSRPEIAESCGGPSP